MGIATQPALFACLFPEFAEDEIFFRKMDGSARPEDNPVTEKSVARILLSGHQQVMALAINAVRTVFILGGRRKAPERTELQQISNIDILGLHPPGEDRIQFL